MQFASLASLTQYLQGVVLPAIEIAEREGLRDGATEIAEEARAMIGSEANGWPALADSTIKEKERLGFTGQVSATDPLLRTGELRDSIVVEIDGHVADIGSYDPVMGYQVFGTPTIPARDPLGGALVRKLEAVAAKIGARVAGVFGRL